MSECIARLEVYRYAFMSPATLKKPAWSATTSGSSRDLTCVQEPRMLIWRHALLCLNTADSQSLSWVRPASNRLCTETHINTVRLESDTFVNLVSRDIPALGVCERRWILADLLNTVAKQPVPRPPPSSAVPATQGHTVM
jgi:hypothetical protein